MRSTDFQPVVSPLMLRDHKAKGGKATPPMNLAPILPAIGALAHALFQHHLAQHPGKHPMAVALELHGKIMKGRKGALHAGKG
jgi:hypothetical protein